jgi:hypothetical protein
MTAFQSFGDGSLVTCPEWRTVRDSLMSRASLPLPDPARLLLMKPMLLRRRDWRMRRAGEGRRAADLQVSSGRCIALNDPLAGQRWGKARSLMFLDCPAFRADLKRRKDIKTASLERTRNKTRVVHGYVGRPAKGKPEPDPFAMLTAADEWAIRYRAKVADIPLAQCVRL